MGNLERLQILTEIVSEFKTAILMDKEPDKTGRLVLEVIQEAGDDELSDFVLNAYLKLVNPQTAVQYLDKARDYLYSKIDQLMN
ncbi:hypothetical protein JOD43_000681 [Pullulanibacillus pueri]|uniref:Uncharacterized protein n=1 Tax=Pullulanibacillus pueri TaxID=1437324 RepID=A0A8J2ZZ55_9BACL|nr:hypothetical protein [Pullulanibacillus pueri]MBM7680519.1 hypothetical protein [Pullulanibacillus pueri]GGH86097.1 hypothetical protein GCM10007096_33010 [Pullulanibacillus pueri]